MAKCMLIMLLLTLVMTVISVMAISIKGTFFVQVERKPQLLASKVVENAIFTSTFLIFLLILHSFMACCLLRWFKRSADIKDVIENGKRKKADATIRFHFVRILLLLILFTYMTLPTIFLFPRIETGCAQQQLLLLTGDKQIVPLKIPDNVTVGFSDAEFELNQKVIPVKNLTTEFIRVQGKTAARLAESVSRMKKTMPDNVKTESIQFHHNACAGLSTFETTFNTLIKRQVFFCVIVLAIMGLRHMYTYFRKLTEAEMIVVVEKRFNCVSDDESSDELAYTVINVEELMDGSLKCSPAEIQIEHETDEIICIEIDA